jgi:hypothetical protein
MVMVKDARFYKNKLNNFLSDRIVTTAATQSFFNDLDFAAENPAVYKKARFVRYL